MEQLLSMKGNQQELGMQQIFKIMIMSVIALLTCMSSSLCKLAGKIKGGEVLIKFILNWNTYIQNQVGADLDKLLALMESIKHVKPTVSGLIRIVKIKINNGIKSIGEKRALNFVKLNRFNNCKNSSYIKWVQSGIVNLKLLLQKFHLNKMRIRNMISEGITKIHSQIQDVLISGILITLILMIPIRLQMIPFENLLTYGGMLMIWGGLIVISILIKALISVQGEQIYGSVLAFRVRCLKGLTRVLKQKLDLSRIKVKPSQVLGPIAINSEVSLDKLSLFSRFWNLKYKTVF